MSFLNFSLSRVAYEDDVASTDPMNKAFDVSTSKVGLHVGFPAVCTRVVHPGQIMLLESTSRTLAYDGTTELAVSHPELGSDLVRMRWTGVGTAPAFRTLRVIAGGSDTQVTLSRMSNTAAKMQVTGGTVWSLSTVQIGDEVFFGKTVDGEFTSPFSEVLQGSRFSIVDKGSDYLVFRDNGIASAESDITLGVGFDSALRVFSAAGVKVGDKLKFAVGANLKPDNKSYVLEITQVSDRDVYFVNPYAVDEIAIPGADSFVAFERMLNFLAVQATGAIDLRLDSSSATSIPLYEYETGASIFMGTVSATSIYAVNNSTLPVNVTVHTCSF
jgi:hypothetical protein